MSDSSRVRLTNESNGRGTLYLEPWGEEYELGPSASVELLAGGPPGRFEISYCDGGMIVYAWSGARVVVLRDGVDVSQSCKDIPAP